MTCQKQGTLAWLAAWLTTLPVLITQEERAQLMETLSQAPSGAVEAHALAEFKTVTRARFDVDRKDPKESAF